MRRFGRIYRVFFTSSLARELEFRANFFAKILQNAVWAGFFVLIILTVYHNTDAIAGWNRGMAFLLAATVFLVSGLCGAFTMGLMEIPQQVRMGTLDFVVARPVDPQFWVSLRRFNFDQFGSILASLGMLAVGLPASGVHASVLDWAGYSVLVGVGVVLFYSLNLGLMTLGIWWVRVDNLWVLGDTALGVARFPIDIFPRGMAWALTYAFPVAFLSTLPARQLVDGFDPVMVGVGLAWAAGALLATRVFWRFALTRYSSASS